MLGRSLAATVIILASVTPVLAAGAKPLGRFGDWEAFTYGAKNAKICYAASIPKKSQNAAKGRGEAYVTVTHRPAAKSLGVVSVSAGYSLKPESSMAVEVGKTRFDLYTNGDKGWARDDKAVVAAMLKGNSMTIEAQPAKGKPTIDTYSLSGFTKAFEEIGKACGVK